MPDYRVTFGAQYANELHPTWPGAHPDGYVTLVAREYDVARAMAFHLFLTHWSELYEPRDWRAHGMDSPAWFTRGQVGYFTEDDVVRYPPATYRDAPPPEPDHGISFENEVHRGRVSARLQVHGVIVNGRASVTHSPMMSRDELAQLASVCRDLLVIDQ